MAIKPPVEATAASGKKRASSEVGVWRAEAEAEERGHWPHLELLRVGSRIQVCYMDVNPCCNPCKKNATVVRCNCTLVFSEGFIADNDPLLADAGSFKVEWINDEGGGDGEEEDEEEDADGVVKAPQFQRDVRLFFLR